MEKSALHVLKVVREAFDTKCLRLSLTQPAALFWRFNTGLEFVLKKSDLCKCVKRINMFSFYVSLYLKSYYLL